MLLFSPFAICILESLYCSEFVKKKKLAAHCFRKFSVNLMYVNLILNSICEKFLTDKLKLANAFCWRCACVNMVRRRPTEAFSANIFYVVYKHLQPVF